jgi:hypothetical protein
MNYLIKYKKYNQKIINQNGGSLRLEKEVNKYITPDLYKNND